MLLRFAAEMFSTFCTPLCRVSLAVVFGGIVAGSGAPPVSVNCTLAEHAARSDARLRKVAKAAAKSISPPSKTGSSCRPLLYSIGLRL